MKEVEKAASAVDKKKKASKPAKKAFSITLSGKSQRMLEELKDYTEAETSTEVIRDALRLAASIMDAQRKGLRVELCDPADDGKRSVIISVGNVIPG